MHWNLMHFVAAPGELDALELAFAAAASGPTIGMELQLELEGLVAGQN